jgi:hypothetical protein
MGQAVALTFNKPGEGIIFFEENPPFCYALHYNSLSGGFDLRIAGWWGGCQIFLRGRMEENIEWNVNKLICNPRGDFVTFI